MSFGSFLIYFNFRIFTAKKIKTRIFFLIFSLVIFYFTLLTGGRAGISVSLIILLLSFWRTLSGGLKIFLQKTKSISKRLILFSIISSLICLSVVFSSLGFISGRNNTMTKISDNGLIAGLYGPRGEILNRALHQDNYLQLFFGKPGLGTNTATQFGNVKKEFKNSDSFITSSLLSFGIFGILIVLITFFLFIQNSYSPLLPIIFLIFSLSQSLPELIFPWIQLVILLSFSNDITIKNSLRKLRDE
jgi:hypothetical protein